VTKQKSTATKSKSYSSKRETWASIKPGAKDLANLRQPDRHEIVTYVSGTFCYPCLRAGPPQQTAWLRMQSVANPSGSKFPANREFNREFFEFGLPSAILAPNRPANSIACSKIPYAMEQGIF
jgi:hypothetical protein